MDGMQAYELTREDGRTQIRFAAFDTGVRICAYGSADDCTRALEQARVDCMAYERLFSRTIADSDVSRVNRARGAWTDVDGRTGELVEAALGYCSASHGAFDITIGSLSGLWDLRRGIIPNADMLAEASRHVDWRGVSVEQEDGRARVRLEDPQAMIDLGGIAKGWIADELDRTLTNAGIDACVIDLGGNILVRGDKPDGSPWSVGLPDPSRGAGAREQAAPVGTIRLARGSVVTSGIYERSCMHDGTLYHHVLDPQTGMPVDVEYPAVSVACEKSMDAEGFSTTLLALGLEEGRELAEERPEILQAYFIGWDKGIRPLRA